MTHEEPTTAAVTTARDKIAEAISSADQVIALGQKAEAELARRRRPRA